jgi:hypothetical protein
MTATRNRNRTRALALPGLLLALVITGTLPAWAGAASARPDQPAVCAVDAAAVDAASAVEAPEPVPC